MFIKMFNINNFTDKKCYSEFSFIQKDLGM